MVVTSGWRAASVAVRVVEEQLEGDVGGADSSGWGGTDSRPPKGGSFDHHPLVTPPHPTPWHPRSPAVRTVPDEAQVLGSCGGVGVVGKEEGLWHWQWGMGRRSPGPEGCPVPPESPGL